MTTKPAKLLWIDLEMTGLDPAKDRILEIGVIITDWDFKEIVTYESAIRVSPDIVEDRMIKGPAATFFASVPETRDALIKQNNETTRTVTDVEADVITLVDTHFDDEKPVILAGNSIHMDRRFIERELPGLNKKLHYRMLDVTAWKVVFEGKYKKKFAKPEAHRALSDIRGSIEELQYYIKKVKR